MGKTSSTGGHVLHQSSEQTGSARGTVFIHACPAALCPHVEWAISGIVGSPISPSWAVQPVDPGQFRTEYTWTGARGGGALIASALRSWPMLRFEVTEEPSASCDGERICHVPGRGTFRGIVGANGDFLVGEQQLRHLLATATSREDLAHGIETVLGAAWDADLEHYRHAGDGSPGTWLHQVS